jgi:hypothetical protein
METIKDKQTALQASIPDANYKLVNLVLGDNSPEPIMRQEDSEGNFECFKIEMAIPADAHQLGSTQNVYYWRSNAITWTTPEDQDTTEKAAAQALSDALTTSSTQAEVEAAYEAWFELQAYTEKQPASVVSQAFPSV